LFSDVSENISVVFNCEVQTTGVRRNALIVGEEMREVSLHG
jgi:hypothetical protein